jgi:hypothetical protein
MTDVSQKLPWLRVTPEPRAAGDNAAQLSLDEDFERFSSDPLLCKHNGLCFLY